MFIKSPTTTSTLIVPVIGNGLSNEAVIYMGLLVEEVI
jgi:hypothetical protein